MKNSGSGFEEEMPNAKQHSAKRMISSRGLGSIHVNDEFAKRNIGLE